jgi:hypothetical protein
MVLCGTCFTNVYQILIYWDMLLLAYWVKSCAYYPI